MTSVSIVIVNYKKSKRLKLALTKLRQTAKFLGDVVVLDNSVDPEEARNLEVSCAENGASLIISDSNVGYTKGVNTAARHVQPGNHVLLMSPDIFVTVPGLIERMVDFLEESPNAGIVAPTQINDDGSSVEVFRNFPSPLAQLARRFPGSTPPRPMMPPPGQTFDVDWVQSSFCLIRNTLWSKIRGLDETYEIFMADTQLAKAAHAEGMRVVGMSINGVFADGIRASAGSVFTALFSLSFRIHCRDALKYYTKNGWLAFNR